MRRLQSVDVLRTVAILAVIVIHTTPFERPTSPLGSTLDLATVVNQAMRFAVPLFFILSGYFWAGKFDDERDLYEPTAKMFWRIAVIFIAWSAIYLIPSNFIYAFLPGASNPLKGFLSNLSSAVHRPVVTALQGTKMHLWFLPALLWSIAISALLVRFRLNWLLAVLAVATYCAGIAGKAYRDTPAGLHVTFNFRDGPFFSLIFFVTGYFLHKKVRGEHWFRLGVLMAAGGAALHFAEIFVVHKYWGTTMQQDYVVGTYFFGVGMALIALSDAPWLQSQGLAAIGPYVLGIYASHFMFYEMLFPLDRRFVGSPTWDILYIVIVFFVAYAVSWALAKNRLTRRLVV